MFLQYILEFQSLLPDRSSKFMLINSIKINSCMYNTYKKRILFKIKKRFQRFRSRTYKKKVVPLRFKTRIFRRRVDLINFNAKKEKLTFKVKLYKIISVRKTRNKNFVEKDLYKSEGELLYEIKRKLKLTEKQIPLIKEQNFSRMTLLLVCLLLFSILAFFSLIVLVRSSLLFTFVSFFIRRYALGNQQIGAKYTVPIIMLLTKNRLFCRFLLLCKRISNKFFKLKSQKLVNSVIFLSKFILVMGLSVRYLIVMQITLPYQQLMLWVLAVNGLFRAIINLGLMLSSGDNLLKQLMEIINRNAGKYAPGVSATIPKLTSDSTQNTNRGDNENNENKKDSKNQNNNNDSQQDNNKFNIGNTLTSIMAATGIGSLAIGWSTLKNTDSLVFQKEKHQEKMQLEKERYQENMQLEKEKHQEKTQQKQQRHQEKMQLEKERYQENMQLEKEKLQIAKDRIATDNRIADGNEARLELEKKKFEAKMLREKSRIITENALSEEEKQKKRRGWFSK